MARTSIGGGFGPGGDVRIDEQALAVFLTSPAGPVGRFVGDLAKKVTAEAKVRAPVGDRDSKLGHPRGYLKSKIGWRLGRDTVGLYADIISPARSSEANPFTPNGPYAYWNEVPGSAPHHSSLPAWIRDNEHPYLRPALESIVGSL
jgi:hypothetical protein